MFQSIVHATGIHRNVSTFLFQERTYSIALKRLVFCLRDQLGRPIQKIVRINKDQFFLTYIYRYQNVLN